MSDCPQPYRPQSGLLQAGVLAKCLQGCLFLFGGHRCPPLLFQRFGRGNFQRFTPQHGAAPALVVLTK